jgi:hypothetical protein
MLACFYVAESYHFVPLLLNRFDSFMRFGCKNHGNTNVFVQLLLSVQFKAVLKREPEYGRVYFVIVRLTRLR